MKMLSLLSATTLGAVVLAWPARADEPQALKLAPEIRKMLDDLLKAADAEPAAAPAPADPAPAKPAPAAPAPASSSSTAELRKLLDDLLKAADAEAAADPAPAKPTPATPATTTTATASSSPTAPSANANGAGIPQPATGLRTGSLRTGSLKGSSLMTSAPLGGRGLTGGTPRLTNEEWREQFPVQK